MATKVDSTVITFYSHWHRFSTTVLLIFGHLDGSRLKTTVIPTVSIRQATLLVCWVHWGYGRSILMTCLPVLSIFKKSGAPTGAFPLTALSLHAILTSGELKATGLDLLFAFRARTICIDLNSTVPRRDVRISATENTHNQTHHGGTSLPSWRVLGWDNRPKVFVPLMDFPMDWDNLPRRTQDGLTGGILNGKFWPAVFGKINFTGCNVSRRLLVWPEIKRVSDGVHTLLVFYKRTAGAYNMHFEVSKRVWKPYKVVGSTEQFVARWCLQKQGALLGPRGQKMCEVRIRKRIHTSRGRIYQRDKIPQPNHGQ